MDVVIKIENDSECEIIDDISINANMLNCMKEEIPDDEIHSIDQQNLKFEPKFETLAPLKVEVNDVQMQYHLQEEINIKDEITPTETFYIESASPQQKMLQLEQQLRLKTEELKKKDIQLQETLRELKRKEEELKMNKETNNTLVTQMEKLQEMLNQVLQKIDGREPPRSEVGKSPNQVQNNSAPSSDVSDENYHLGQNIWVNNRERMKIWTLSQTPGTFVGDILELVMSREVLKTHSLTGAGCNANKDMPKKPALCEIRLAAIKNEYKQWITERYGEKNDKEIKLFNRYVQRKLASVSYKRKPKETLPTTL